jgi:hypothetical protein
MLLQEAGDSFGFPIMEDALGKESAEEILYQAQDLSMKWHVVLFNADVVLTLVPTDTMG